VAYIKGTRLAVYWVVQRVRKGIGLEQLAEDLEVSVGQINAALAYAEAFREEIKLDLEEAESNRQWLELQEGAWRAGHPSSSKLKARLKAKH
jgi:uncharacterized protein (DUF433 family)